MKLVAYIAVVVDTQDDAEAADAISEAMRNLTSEPKSAILDWQHINPAKPFEELHKYEYENWRVPPRLLEGV